MCSLLVENAPAKAKAIDLEHLMSETEPAKAEWTEGKLDLVDPNGNSEFLSFFVGDIVFFCSVLTWFTGSVCITAHRYLTEEVQEPNLDLQHAQMLLDFWGPHDEDYKEEVGN